MVACVRAEGIREGPGEPTLASLRDHQDKEAVLSAQCLQPGCTLMSELPNDGRWRTPGQERRAKQRVTHL